MGVDPNADVALLKVDPDGLSLTPLQLGESHTIAVGEPVAAIGSPFGERQSLSIGVISAARPQHPVADAASRSATRSRPTPRSTPATPADRCSTPTGGCSASTRRSSRSPAAARAWASRSRWTPCAARCASCAPRDGGLRLPGRGDADALAAAGRAHRRGRATTGALVQEIEDGSPAEDCRPAGGRRRHHVPGRRTTSRVGGDLIVAVDGQAAHPRSTIWPTRSARTQRRRQGRADGRARRQAAQRSKSSWASARAARPAECCDRRAGFRRISG